jgi:hypothetical protein
MTSEIIEDLLRYDCIVTAQALLFEASRFLAPNQLFEALVLAWRLDHLPSARRIIPQGLQAIQAGLFVRGKAALPGTRAKRNRGRSRGPRMMLRAFSRNWYGF